RWAVVGSVGVGALPGGMAPGDSDIVTLIDVSKRPFRAIQHLTTPSMPEGVALSPDGKWLVVSALNGSNLPATAPSAGRQPKGRLLLFSLGATGATKVSDLPGGEASQGVVFSKDSRTVIVQFNVEKQLAIFRIQNGKLTDSGQRLKLDAGPVSIRSMPR
ncbi:MAG: lactonase, 7-bladed beta-propeller family protein, partial [Caulobacteraceae bacterium]|nr:lactonase, 7-bladed beta-propeller family protein [Caulobacteraceae bacterium]